MSLVYTLHNYGLTLLGAFKHIYMCIKSPTLFTQLIEKLFAFYIVGNVFQ